MTTYHRRDILKFGLAAILSTTIPNITFGADLSCREYLDGSKTCRATVDEVPYKKQETENGDLAACVQMLMAHNNYDLEQKQITEMFEDKFENHTDYGLLNHLDEIRWRDTNGKRFRLKNDFISKDILTLSNSLKQNYPLIVQVNDSCLVLTEINYDVSKEGVYELNRATVLDPAPHNVQRLLSLREWDNIDFVARVSPKSK